MEVGETIDRSGLRKEGRARSIRRRPRQLVTGVLHLAHDLDPPALYVGRLVAQRLEGNTDLDLVPNVGDPPLGLKDIVRVEVRVLASRGGDRETL